MFELAINYLVPVSNDSRAVSYSDDTNYNRRIRRSKDRRCSRLICREPDRTVNGDSERVGQEEVALLDEDTRESGKFA